MRPAGWVVLVLLAQTASATRWIIIRRVRNRPQAPVMPVAYPKASATAAATPTSYDGPIRDVADRHGVEYALVKAVIKAESDFNHLAVSPKGARGIMQLMPQTAAAHEVRNVFLPRDNIEGGCRHLRMLLDP